MFGKAKDLAEMLKNAKKLQGNMEEAKKKLGETIFTGTANGVEISVNGNHNIVALKLPEANSVTTNEQSVMDAYHQCLEKINQASANQIAEMSKDFNLDDL